MKPIREKIKLARPASAADFFRVFKEMKSEMNERSIGVDKKIKIAVLTSFTTKGFEEILSVKCLEAGIFPEFYVGDYNQYNQEILDESSELYRFDPELIILFVDLRTVMGEHYFHPYDMSDVERRDWADTKLAEFKLLIDKIKEGSSAKILLHNLEVPTYSPLGIVENKREFGFIESIEYINEGLRDTYKKDNQVFLFDYNSFCSFVGKYNVVDDKMYHIADMKVDLQTIPKLCEAYMSYIKPIASVVKKCIVLDLDNTLWGGIIGEDGIEGIRLGPNPEGRAFFEFQKHLLALFKRGIILAVNSKNNLDDALEVFRSHPDMILKEEHFAAMQINWNDKASNMRALAEELSIGLESFVFFDDDKLNREIVSIIHPEILVVDLPEDPSLYTKTLMEMNDFNNLQITGEDTKKGQMYEEQRKRKDFQSIATDISDYLKGLEMRVTIEKINDFNTPRIVQLTQKTNQFNMTTRRYLEEDLLKFSKRGDLIISVKVKDKFGDNGITGAAIVEKKENVWRIDTFLLSCRIIGRKVEETLLSYILDEAKKKGVNKVVGEFITTQKNAPSKDFYKQSGFEFLKRDGEIEVWQHGLSEYPDSPDFIQVIIQ